MLDTTRQFAGVESMKKYSTVFRMALAAVTATAIAGFCAIAGAQTSSTTNAAVATPPPAASPPAPTLLYGVGEVVKMYQGGINKEVIINYINNTALPYHLTADAIIYLQNLGMPQEITRAMIQRDGQLQQQQMAMQQAYQQQAMQAQASAQAQAQYAPGAPQPPPQDVAAPSTPPPAVTVVGSDYPAYYDYGYPYYGYGWPYYYGGPWVVGGWGWGGRGWGYGHGGYRGGGGFHGGGGHGGGGGHR
jgi:uncharacterized membrane protein YgcG